MVIDTVHIYGQALAVHHYRPRGTPRCPAVLLLSGDGGWVLGVVAWARQLAAEGHEVVGVDAARLVRISGARGLKGIADAWPTLSRLASGPSVVLGYSRGATLGLALAALAPTPPDVVLLGVDLEDRFGGAAVPPGLAPGRPDKGSYVVDLRPLYRHAPRTARVALIHGALDRVAPYDSLRRWFDALPEPKRVTILPQSGHGFGDSRVVLPAIHSSLDWAAERVCRVLEKPRPPGLSVEPGA